MQSTIEWLNLKAWRRLPKSIHRDLLSKDHGIIDGYRIIKSPAIIRDGKPLEITNLAGLGHTIVRVVWQIHVGRCHKKLISFPPTKGVKPTGGGSGASFRSTSYSPNHSPQSDSMWPCCQRSLKWLVGSQALPPSASSSESSRAEPRVRTNGSV